MKTTLVKSMLAATVAAGTAIMANASTQLTASNGDTLSGTYGDHYYTVANNATVTLDGLDITCGDYDHAVIECQGNATLILAPGSVNSVFADHRYGYSSAIHIPSGYTLTIKGSGALTARTYTQDKHAAGIGGWAVDGSDTHPAGNIVISGGTITAIGGNTGAGIGAAKYAPCGDITITGDAVVTATSGGGAAGIGGADEPSSVPVSYCGNITISGTATVTATGGKWYSAGIGAGGDSRCGNITIANTVTDVTATRGSYSGVACIGKGCDYLYTSTAGTITIGSCLDQTYSNDNCTLTLTPRYTDIDTVEEFNAIANDLTGLYRLTADIDLQNVQRAPFGEFSGILDGNGHAIRNLNIRRTAVGYGTALFQTLKDGAVVRNLALEGGTVRSASYQYPMGGIAGYVHGNGVLIEGCTVDLDIAGSDQVGGIVGYAEYAGSLTIRCCRSFANVTSTGNNAGGILGQRMWGTVVISNTYWTTEVHGNYKSDTHTVGYGEDSSTIRDTPAILDGFAKNTFSVRTRGNGTGTAAYVNGEFVATPDAGSVFIRWEGLPPKEGDYNETTVWAVFGKPVASLADLRAMELGGYYVQTADIDLAGVTGFTGLGFGGYGNTTFRGYYDGDNHEIRNMAIADGNGLFRTGVEYSEIRNLRIVDACVTNSNGATGALASDSSYTTLSNVHVVGGSVTATRDRNIGGFVGTITSGIVEDCSCSATVTGGTGQTGGFAGSSSDATIRRCRATGAVTASGSTAGGFVGNAGGTGVISECYASGDVTAANQNAGGFVGYDKGGAKISDCFALGAVCATNGYAGGFIGYGYMVTCTNCFSVGEATVDSGNVGGFGTQNYSVKFSGSCWDIETSGLGTESGAGEVGRTTAQMQSGVAFEGWDETVWKFSEGLYPRLRAFIPKHTVTWVDDDGTTVLAEGLVEEFETPVYGGATPAKAATAQYTYTFAGWTPAVVAIESNTTYTATYDATVNTYTITWLDDDDSVISTGSVPYGSTPTCAAPSKEDTAQYTYTFAGWTPAVAPVTGAATYKATYTPALRSYTITWKDDDGSAIGTDTLTYGSTPSHAAMTKEPTAQYTYAFTGWSPAIATVTGPATYTATYSQTVNTYTITWLDEDGSSLGTTTVAYGQTPTHAAPTKAEDTYSTYTFSGWSPSVVSVTGNATYTAQFTTHPKWSGDGTDAEPYTLATSERIAEILALDDSSEIFVQTGNGVTAESITANLPAGYAVRETSTAGVVKVVQILEVVWYDDDGTVLRRDEVDAGDMPSYGTPPTKASTAQYDYAFAGWTPTIVVVSESASYTATYTPTLRSYTITWLDADGTQIGTATVAYGQTPSHAAPASVYTFTGWSPAPVAVTNDATYTATFSQTVNLANLTGDYTAADGDVLTGTTAHNVTVPGGVTVTVNGVSVTGAGGGAAPAEPAFDSSCEAVTTRFEQVNGNSWRIVAFSELAAGTADGVDGMVTILRGTSPDAVTTPMTPDALKAVNAVKVEAIVTPPSGAPRQFFKVQFGE